MIKKRLDPSEVWHLSAQALHTKTYIGNYVDALQFVIRDKGLQILDTACGSGFPLLQLYQRGFTNIAASDADAYSVETLQSALKQAGAPVNVFASMWQDLAQKIPKKFDVIINADNSFVYMDGWDVESDNYHQNFKSGKEYAFNRAKLVLQNFYDLLNKDGLAIVGLGKHYEPPTREYGSILGDSKLAPLIIDGQEAEQKWYGHLDWENRVHEWYTTIVGETVETTVLRKSYLYTKIEMADLMKEVGFSKVHILEPDGTRDNLIIGIK